MKLEQQVCSLELAKQLKDLGVKQRSLFGYVHFDKSVHRKGGYDLEVTSPEAGTRSFYVGREIISAFTVAELGEMLPQVITFKNVVYQLFVSLGLDKQWFVVYANVQDYEDNAPFPIMMTHNEADARAKMMIYLLENKLIK